MSSPLLCSAALYFLIRLMVSYFCLSFVCWFQFELCFLSFFFFFCFMRTLPSLLSFPFFPLVSVLSCLCACVPCAGRTPLPPQQVEGCLVLQNSMAFWEWDNASPPPIKPPKKSASASCLVCGGAACVVDSLSQDTTPPSSTLTSPPYSLSQGSLTAVNQFKKPAHCGCSCLFHYTLTD